MLKLEDATAEQLTQARFEQHVQSMSRLASVLLRELRGPMTRLLYDAEFIGRQAHLERDGGLRETFVDVQGSSQDLQVWVDRLARFVERGVDASEEISVGELVGLATRAAGTSKERVLSFVEHADPLLPVATNVVLASEMLAELFQVLAHHAGATHIRVTTEAAPPPTGGVRLQLRPSEPFQPSAVAPDSLTSGGMAARPSPLDILNCTIEVLGGSLVLARDGSESAELTLPSVARTSAWRKSK